MRIGLASDLHLNPKNPLENLELLLPERGSVDIMILLGDIAFWSQIPEVLQRTIDLVGCRLAFIPGNHDYYVRRDNPLSMVEIESWWRSSIPPGSTLLIDEPLELDGVSIFGSTWWSSLASHHPLEAVADTLRNFPDFHCIVSRSKPGSISVLEPEDLPYLNADAKSAFARWHANAKGKKVLATHFPVLRMLAHPRFGFNPYFTSPDEKLVEKSMLDLILFGHTHWNFDTDYCGTRCLSNMAGYPIELGNVNFRKNLVIEI